MLWTALTLQNGWVGGPYATARPAVADIAGIVDFRGAMSTTGTNPTAFRLPAAFRPATRVYVVVDLCNATKGRLNIATNGIASVQAPGPFQNAKCFTSLDGASFAAARSPKGQRWTALSLKNGWKGKPAGTAAPAVILIDGIVHFKGAMSTGKDASFAFTLPPGFRPPKEVSILIDLCGGKVGRLTVTSAGDASVDAEIKWADAQCLTSLDGATFAGGLTPKNQVWTTLALENGWAPAYIQTGVPSVTLDGGIVRFRGEMATTKTNNLAFTLAVPLRPAHDVYAPVSLCNATKGRIYVSSSTGSVYVQVETKFSNAQCLTSLDGAWYAK